MPVRPNVVIEWPIIGALPSPSKLLGVHTPVSNILCLRYFVCMNGPVEKVVTVCACLHEQMEKVESELRRSKSLRERESLEFERQRDELLRAHSKQLAELKLAAELEQARLTDEFRTQTELQRVERENEMTELRQTLLADTADVERRAKEQAENDSKVKCDFTRTFLDIYRTHGG